MTSNCLAAPERFFSLTDFSLTLVTTRLEFSATDVSLSQVCMELEKEKELLIASK